jgi:hypothetical protein
MNKKKLKKRIKELEDENTSLGIKTMLAYVEIEELKEQLSIQRVSNRRELLKHYSNFLYENEYLTKDNVLMEYELSLL